MPSTAATIRRASWSSSTPSRLQLAEPRGRAADGGRDGPPRNVQMTRELVLRQADVVLRDEQRAFALGQKLERRDHIYAAHRIIQLMRLGRPHQAQARRETKAPTLTAQAVSATTKSHASAERRSTGDRCNATANASWIASSTPSYVPAAAASARTRFGRSCS